MWFSHCYYGTLFHWMNTPRFIHSSISEHWKWFQVCGYWEIADMSILVHDILCIDFWSLTKKKKKKRKQRNVSGFEVTAKEKVMWNERERALQEWKWKPEGKITFSFTEFICSYSSVTSIAQGWTVLAGDVDCSARCFRLRKESCFGNSWQPQQSVLSTEQQ